LPIVEPDKNITSLFVNKLLNKTKNNEENGFAKFIKGEKPEPIHKEFFKKLSLS
jgi:hypothetical protein